MEILEFTKITRDKIKLFGRYRYVSEKSGVSYEWLCKFAAGKITNPTIENISKLEVFLKSHDDSSLIKNIDELSIDGANYKGIERRNRQH